MTMDKIVAFSIIARLVNGIANNVLFKVLAGIVSLLGVISTAMTIILGWGAFLAAIQNLFTP